jgi:succinoglycan biosynthesis transport protein ExoP
MQIMISPVSLRRIVQEFNLDKPRPGEAADHVSLSDLVQSFRTLVGIEEASKVPQSSLLTFLNGLFARVGIDVGEAKPALPDPERLTNLAVEDLNRKLAVAPIGRSTMIRVQYSARDPKLAADVANAIATNYIDARYRGRIEAVANASEWLRQHTDALRNELVEAEARLAAFRSRSVVGGRDAAQLQNEIRVLTENIVATKAVQQKAASRLAVAEERASREGPMALLNWETGPGGNEYLAQVRAISDMRKEASKLAAVQGPFSSNATRLETEARNLERQLTIEAQTRLANLKMSAEAATRDVTSLEQSLQSLRADYDKLDAKAVQLSAFERAAAASRAVYENFVTRWRATEQAGFNEAKGWLVSPASVPPLPSKPSLPLILLGSLVTAVGAGFSNARYKEYRDSRTIRTSEDIERHLPGIRLLGLLPELSKRHRHPRAVVAAAHDASDPEFSEAARSLYASLKAATEHDRPVTRGRVVLVSSALPIEAKSSTTGVIASLASAAGQRVIVVDCDMRSPTMHDALTVEPIPGLAECIEMGMTGECRVLGYFPPADRVRS